MSELKNEVLYIRDTQITGDIKKVIINNGTNLTHVEYTRADEWQPIRTAPRDGTKILCFAPGKKKAVCLRARTPQTRTDYWGTIKLKKKYSGFQSMYPESPYTHWMKLPEPPKEDQS